MKKTLVILCALLSFTCFAGTVPQQSTSTDGRYVMIINPNIRADQYILDTKTGKVWQHIVSESGIEKWQCMLYENFDNAKGKFSTGTIPQ